MHFPLCKLVVGEHEKHLELSQVRQLVGHFAHIESIVL
jgi:hypothetical protein